MKEKYFFLVYSTKNYICEIKELQNLKNKKIGKFSKNIIKYKIYWLSSVIISSQIFKSNYKEVWSTEIVKTLLHPFSRWRHCSCSSDLPTFSVSPCLSLFSLKSNSPSRAHFELIWNYYSTPLRPQFSSLRKRLTYNSVRSSFFTCIAFSFHLIPPVYLKFKFKFKRLMFLYYFLLYRYMRKLLLMY